MARLSDSITYGNHAITGDVTVGQNLRINGTYILGDSKRILSFYDPWLRLNPNNDFGNGIFAGTGIFRTDGELQVGPNGSQFKVPSSGNIVAGATVDVTGNITMTGSLVSSGDSNTYVQFHAADQFRVVTGGTERFEVTNSGATHYGPLSINHTNVQLNLVDTTYSNNYWQLDHQNGTLNFNYNGTAPDFIIAESGNATFRHNLTVDGTISGDGSGLTNLPAGVGVPSGVITMWSGSIASIPSGWVLCDGANGTPNLQDRFVVGAGNSYAVGATGGSKDAVVVSHSHNGIADFSGGHSHTINSNGSHRHIEGAAQGSAYSSGYYPYGRITSPTRSGFTWGNYDSTSYEIYTDYSGTHSHTMASAPNHQHLLDIDPSGESGVDKNLPPYYALAFIMKT
ncbi:MAG: hypothetical protein GOVbin1096_55 [Prokaryotic dsDNA virus sp.]|jgi:hypothetical protein|nr:MAG: hypothetical protein GOVbin1096_55 [Prokaryotic dsDNA virus sp.]|tara:strand:- start:72184 stop:73374 length:1191 start_codon:yes stop_codon:yes gene_type:complete